MTVEEQPHRAAADSSSHAMAGIIVIEDDQLIRALLLEWLSAEGYLVLLRSHAEPLPDEDAALMSWMSSCRAMVVVPSCARCRRRVRARR
jgi:hypothetical protein